MAIAITMAEVAVAATITDQTVQIGTETETGIETDHAHVRTQDLFQLFRNQEHAGVKNLKK